MKLFKTIYQALVMASAAHARWDYEASMSILKNRKKLLILIALSLPILAVMVTSAADLPHILGGKKAYAPATYTTTIFLSSIAIGLIAGLITGCIGAGGGFVIAPALMSAGIKGITAVGTDLFHIFAKAIMGTAVHKKLGNVSTGLAVAFVFGSIFGVLGGGVINRALYNMNPLISDTFISIIYAVLLGFLGIYAMLDFVKASKKGDEGGAHGGGPVGELTGLPVRMQSIKIPPMIAFDEDVVPGGRKLSFWIVAIMGSFVGLVAAIMGVGGGFLTFPIFVYMLGVSSFTTVGTDILQIIMTAGFASISQYAIYGFVFYTLAMGMLLGSLIGIQVGALTTKVVRGIYIRAFYAMAVLAGFFNRLFALPKKFNELGWIDIAKSTASMFDTIGIILFFIVVTTFGVFVFGKFFGNLKELRGEG
ncbi:MAG: sulfite exporter TauE/SafE family protein [Desulfovibrionales bacterium]|nr:sulfite exporter TauE/SafE family protein [Desulfovibrionales bacterium]